ncbi:hypothetical protein N7468_000339 [Penicillium chermesinum]|uniref:Uncharacterized protein n=1 Tax=Penicillium chermesinum TaxID=63820 RepID=A0A9W9PLS8_9EURO|nr:uncharacterized protein N7468_000339 [Penicillium chermesinum]KAJ5248888.1 hypothetical protein N7468_000339 [Penicillium chermesinum]
MFKSGHGSWDTRVAGYVSNYELFVHIGETLDGNPNNISIKQYEDEGNILIYDGNWVSWLTPESYAARRAWTDGLNFAGTSDWAADLNTTYGKNGTGDELPTDGEDNYQICDYGRSFDDLDSLNSMLDTAYANYTAVNNGYDELYGYYVKYMEKLVPEVLSYEFMFNLSETGKHAPTPKPGIGMNYGATYELIDEDGYNAKLGDLGLEPDWVVLADYTYKYAYEAQRYGEVDREWSIHNFPTKNESMEVPNPKDIITKGLPNMDDLRTQLSATMMDIMLGQWINGTAADAVQVYSAPIFLMMQAVDGMAQVKQLGTKEEEDEEDEEAERKRKKNFILLIISVVLMFVPVVGEEFAAAAGLATLARSMAIAGELANGAYALFDTIDDPSSAVVNVLGMLFGLGNIAKIARDGKGIASAAKVRTAMKSSEVSSLGTSSSVMTIRSSRS